MKDEIDSQVNVASSYIHGRILNRVSRKLMIQQGSIRDPIRLTCISTKNSTNL